jgi:hypothetical protein
VYELPGNFRRFPRQRTTELFVVQARARFAIEELGRLATAAAGHRDTVLQEKGDRTLSTP